MKLSETKAFLTNKWHLCQTNMALYDELTPSSESLPHIEEMPTKDGLYLIYMWDFIEKPYFHYEIVKYESKITFNPEFFLKLDNNYNQYNHGQIPFNQVLKWMYYDDFKLLIEGII